ncbi:FG-GAP-like repeat-containing protein [Streptomyces griseorubiginosus]|uniref:FG-GAP-like repeat-containing protein n=1 Tax=Streptomyces griseorubiginosus TaxID=67304 RepID=UPI002E81B1EF|nr:FG-GAP-like repeat-containing protein [Streptomyces griseorubiginosus]WUB45692.1 FG-GAP-like repeat-containing protein [Streptomyces griseorubiginosus]WUB54210.1 FG-GAP-like repeat-containing protein [Streptomyces griseorubiginosus]
MGRYALPRRRLAVAISSVALALAGGAVLPTTAVAAPAVPVPWTSATAVTGADTDTHVKDLVTAADGSAVAVWNQFADTDATERKLYAAVRPADSDTWGAPVLLTTTPDEAGGVKLHASADGTVTALWTEYPDETSPGAGPFDSRVVSSVLSADHSAWSTPVDLVGTDTAWGDGGIDLAEAPDGTLTAVWSVRLNSATSPWEVYGATRAADGTWSAPAQLSDTAADGADSAHSPSVAVTSDGTVVVVWKQTDGPSASVRTASRAPGATTWTAPAAATPSYQSISDPEVSAADDGTVTVAWKGTDESEDQTILTAARSADGTWAAPETVTATEDLAATPEPLIAPDGDVTLVWVDYTTTFSARTATRDAATGTWSAAKTLSTGYASEAYDTAIAADGTVHALWPQSGGNAQGLVESVGSDGQWTTPTPLPGSSFADVIGQISVGADGTASAVWSGATSDSANWHLFGSRTAWPALAVSGSSVPASAPLKGTTATSNAWAPAWTLSRPTSSWSVTLTDTAGRTVRTLTGSPAGLGVTASWNGRTTAGTYAANGPLTWTLRATQEGAASAVKLASGTVTVTGGAAVARDFGGASATPDGTGDLLTLNSSGALTFQMGKASTGAFAAKVSGSGWPTTVKAIPFGDLNGDRCNDVLVRLSSGALRLYKPGCGSAVKPSTSYTSLGTSGWNQYDILTSPGDISGDGRPDLIARNASTGTVYLYKGTSTGKLSARVKLYDNWKGYKKIVGVGDLNGDGRGDLLAQDKSNVLYRYEGTGSGTFKARVKLFTNWGGSYNVVVGVGDLTGDGKTDLVSRDTGGVLWRNNGDGKGSFGARAKISTGWQGYKSLS